MTTVVSGATAPVAAPEKKAARSLESVSVAPDKGFAGMLGRMETASPLTFRKPKGGQGAAVSFAAMPLVAPALVDAAVNRDRASNPMAAMPAGTRSLSTSSLATSAAPDGEPPRQSRATAIAPLSPDPVPGNGAAIRQAAAPVGRAAPTRPVSSSASLPMPPLGTNTDTAGSAPDRPGRAELPRAAAPATFDLGSGVTIHLTADPVNPRVLVRGVRIGAGGRGEIMTRIVRLMRSHGFAVSEQAIEFDGGRSE